MPGLTRRKADQIRRRMTRLEEHYQIPLALAVAFAENAAVSDLFATGRGELPAIEFYLPELYEAFVERCLRESLSGTGVRLRVQYRDRSAIFDGFGDPYREVRPDFVLFRDGKPVAVVDAKFKPRYLRGGPTGRPPKRNRVSSRDIYQVSFYQARLKSSYSLPKPPPAYIVAPALNGSAQAPRMERRRVRWRAEPPATDGFGLDVIALPIEEVLDALGSGKSTAEAVKGAPEVSRLLRTVSAGPHVVGG